ncbi:zinc finger protein 77-like [Folsomia candida]|uniref:zinc finger protein 77-like n=1 Tax=Folsomia candida TaxID=158441 RepID=UPI00160542BC|nr:zinc finger protein 77-like [Folsomia candida]
MRDLRYNFPKHSTPHAECSQQPERPSCDTCHRVFFDLPTLRKHINTVHNPKDRPHFACTFPGCEKTYQRSGHLRAHVNSEHTQNPVRYPCTLCGKEFKNSPHLKRHIATHTTEKPHNCATCGRSFAEMETMKSHETHVEKSTRDVLKWHVCSQTFISRRSLRAHIRVVHENRKNYPCEFCGKSFSSAKDFERHVEARHPTNEGLKTHYCDKCEYRSHSKHNLTMQAKRHNAANRECYFCRKKFLNFQEFVQHSRTHTLEK